MTDGLTIRDNRDANRYELDMDGAICIAAYECRDGAIAFTHTEVPEVFEGRGLASQLIRGALADVRSQGLKIVPLCAFVAGYIERHPEEQDLLATNAPG
jgi:predicted GNAT family acetyltransferase